MRSKITLLPGDGIGPEVVAEGVRVLHSLGQLFGHTFDFQEAWIGGCAIERSGTPWPEASRQACSQSDAVLLGAVGGPQWSDPRAPVRPEQGLLALRQDFDLFANLRPVKAYPALYGCAPIKSDVLAGTDILIVRELTGGLYYGARQEAEVGPPGSQLAAWDTMYYSAPQIRRVAQVAFQAAALRRGLLTSVDKANVLASSRLWRRVVD